MVKDNNERPNTKQARTTALFHVTAEGAVCVRDARLYYLLARQQKPEATPPAFVNEDRVIQAA